jgi:hypothetical protein
MSNDHESVFPFDLDGVRVLSESSIEHDGRVWRAEKRIGPASSALRRNWLLTGARTDVVDEHELWLAVDGSLLEPSMGPAWVGEAYVPTPEYVREQTLRRRAGLPLREREWIAIRPNPPDRRGG